MTVGAGVGSFIYSFFLMKSIKSVQCRGMACGIWTSKCEKGALQTFIL